MYLNKLIKHFSPSWYTVVMGTGGLANVLYLLSVQVNYLKPIAIGLWYLNIGLFILLIGPWLARWFLHFDKLSEDLKHTMLSNFFVTMPVGALILGTNFFLIGKEYFAMTFISQLALWLWSISAVLILMFGVYAMYNLFTKDDINHEHVNFSWFITPVASIVVPLLGNPLAKYYVATNNLDLARFINLTDVMFYGIGFILFIIIASVVINSLIHHNMPHAAMTPTFWIILGPIGVGTVSLMGIADVFQLLHIIDSTAIFYIFASILWGFGLWAIMLTILITIKYWRTNSIPFSLSWWAFIFPLAAYTMASYYVYNFSMVQAVNWYTIFLAILLTALWLVVLIRSILAIFHGGLLVPKNTNDD